MKAKTTKKALSLLLAVIMLFGMIPAGVITISASAADYEIKDADSWNEIHDMSWAATDATTFSGKVIEISEDIEITSEFKLPLFKVFEGTLQGVMQSDNKYSEIKLAAGTEVLETDAVIAIQTSGTVAVKNLVFNGINVKACGEQIVEFGYDNLASKKKTTVTATDDTRGTPYAIVSAENMGTGTFENLTFSGCDMKAKSAVDNGVFTIGNDTQQYHNMMGGLLLGFTTSKGITVNNIIIEDSSATVSDSAGLGIGWAANNVTVNGFTIKNSTMEIWLVAKNNNVYCGGIVARIGSSSVITINDAEIDEFDITAKENAYIIGLVSGNAEGNYHTLTNSEIKNSSIICEANSQRVGAAVGTYGGNAAGDKIENVTLQNVTVKTADSKGYTGGLIGYYYIKNPTTNKVSALTVKGVTLDTVTVENTAGHAGGIVGTMNGVKEDTFENIKITGLTLNAKAATSLTTGSGGLIGVSSPTATTHTLNIKNVSITESSVTDSAYAAGGLIGVSTKLTRAKNTTAGAETDVPVTHNINIENVYLDVDVTSNTTENSTGAGGIFGACGERNSGGGLKDDNVQSRVTNNGTINVKSCVIKGNISGARRAAGVAAYYGYMASTFNVQNCLIAPETLVITDSDSNKTGLIIAKGFRLWDDVAINVSDCITTTDDHHIIYQLSGTFLYNGTKYSANNQEFPYAEDNGFILAKEGTGDKALFALDSNGFLSFVRGHVSSGYWQAPLSAKEAGETYSIRVIAVTMIDITDSNFGIKIVVKDTAGNIIHDYSQDNLTFELYDGLNEYSEEEGLDRVSASEKFGGKKFIAAVINGIPAGEAYNIEVTPYVGATEYVTHTIMIGANGQPA